MDPKSDVLTDNTFLTVLQRKEINDGLLTEASEQLRQAALAAMRSGKKATVTVVLTLEPEKGALSIGATVNSKVPPNKSDSLTIFYVDDDGGLHRNNPRQRELPLQAHDGGQAEPQESEEAASVAH